MSINVICVIDELESYIECLKRGEDAKESWERLVIAPYWERLCCYAPFSLDDRKPAAIADAAKLQAQVNLLKQIDVGALNREFEKIAADLPNYDDDPITVALFPLDDNDVTAREKQNGVIGTALFGNMIIRVNPLADDFRLWIPYVFAHEYHHTVFGNCWYCLHGGELCGEFSEALITDGEADSFALSLYPQLKPEWVFGVSENDALTLWNETYKKLAYSKEVDYETYMFGDEKHGIPWCAGYAVGNLIIRRYLSKNKTDVRKLLETKPEEIMKNLDI